MTVDPIRLVESALFSAGKPLSLEEVTQATKLSVDEVQASLKALHAEYEARPTALEVVKSGAKWAMAVRAAYSEYTKMLAAPEIPRKVLKTLTLIAFHQPVKQSDLKDWVGSVVYDHVHELRDRGMITVRESGVTKVLQTTERFLEYFGIAGTERHEIRGVLAQRLGIDPDAIQPPKPQTPIETITVKPLEEAPPTEPAETVPETPAPEATTSL